MRTHWLVVVIAVVGLCSASMAKADEVVITSFEPGGTLAYAGGAAPLQGTLGSGFACCFTVNYPSQVVVFGLPCCISFSTGPFVGSDASHWYFEKGGFLAVYGTVGRPDASGNPIGDVLIPATNLITGTLLSGSFGCCDGTSRPIFIGTFEATLNPDFANLVGMPTGVYDASLMFTTPGYSNFGCDCFPLPAAPPDAFQAGSGVMVTLTVFEPSSILLLTTGMAGFAAFKGKLHAAGCGN